MMVDPQSRLGPTFEHAAELGYLSAWWATVKEILTDPMRTFHTMRHDGLGSVSIYVAITGAISGAVFGLWMALLMALIGGLASFSSQPGSGAPFVALVVMYVVLPPLLIPLSLLVGMFLNGSLIHLALMATGGARRPWETTIRSMGYSMTAMVPMYFMPPIPCLYHLVILAASIYLLVLQVIALHEAHENEWWQAVLGVLLPMIVAFGLCFVVVLIAGAAGSAAGSSGGF